jgi:hypothetical protein
MTLLILVPNQKKKVVTKNQIHFMPPFGEMAKRHQMFMKNITCVIRPTWSLWQHPKIGRCLKFKTIHLLII